MKKLIILPAIALLVAMGLFTLGQQSKSAHAAGPTVVQTGQQQSTLSNEKPDGVESATETKDTTVDLATDKGSEQKGTETDGPGGHQDAQGANVNHDFQGNE